MFTLTATTTRRALPQAATSREVADLPNRANGESIGYNKGGEEAVILSADNKVLATYTWQD